MNKSLAHTVSVTGCAPLYREWYLHFLNQYCCQQSLRCIYRTTGSGNILFLQETPMADDHPKTLQQYCDTFKSNFFDLHLPCIFCSCILTTQDLASFADKNLSLVLRGSQYYACCSICCCVSARFEFDKHCQCSIRAVDIEEISGQHLHALLVRCYNCLKKLDIAEKYDLVCKDELFYLVRSQWKGLCRKCVPK